MPPRTVFAQLLVSLLPALAIAASLVAIHRIATNPVMEVDTAGLETNASLLGSGSDPGTGLAAPSESATGLAAPADAPQELNTPPEPPNSTTAVETSTQSPLASAAVSERTRSDASPLATGSSERPDAASVRLPTPNWFWTFLVVCVAILAAVYGLMTWERLQVFKLLLASFFPLALLIIAVLGSIVFGFATPTEAAAVGAFGGFVLAAVYRVVEHWRAVPRGVPKSRAFNTSVRELGVILKDSSFLTAKTTAMVCWLFVGSAIFSAAFALLGGQELVEKWVLSLDMTPVQFMILAQFIIFILGWPLEWTEIIVIFMPIFIPLLPHFHIDPLFFGLLVALNLQTAFLSPPVAMAAFYLKGVAPPHVTLNQIFAGMMPFMGIQLIALVLLYIFPGIGLWLPQAIYK